MSAEGQWFAACHKPRPAGAAAPATSCAHGSMLTSAPLPPPRLPCPQFSAGHHHRHPGGAARELRRAQLERGLAPLPGPRRRARLHPDPGCAHTACIAHCVAARLPWYYTLLRNACSPPAAPHSFRALHPHPNPSCALSPPPRPQLPAGGLILPDSPNSLIERGKKEEGRRILAKIRGTDEVDAGARLGCAGLRQKPAQRSCLHG